MNQSFNSVPSPENPIIFSSVAAEEFIVQRNKLHPELFAFLTPHTSVDYESAGTKLFLSEDRLSGFGVNPDGELVSVFALERSRGKTLVAEARKQGALYLSCMGEYLRDLYGEFGFSPVEVMQWNNRFAPSQWNYERFGTPNIYDMRLIKSN